MRSPKPGHELECKAFPAGAHNAPVAVQWCNAGVGMSAESDDAATSYLEDTEQATHPSEARYRTLFETLFELYGKVALTGETVFENEANALGRHFDVRAYRLEQITRAIGERQDVRSIFQVVVRTIEEQLPVDFCCIGLYDTTEYQLTVAAVSSPIPGLTTQLSLASRLNVSILGNAPQCIATRNRFG